MKTKALFLFNCLIVLSSFKPTQQINDSQLLYKVSIFKWAKNEKGEEQMKVVAINQNGKITLNGKPVNEKLHILNYTLAVNKFIKGEKLVKDIANDEPPKVVTVPKNGEQSISMAIIMLKDFNDEKDKNYANNSQYVYSKIKKSSDQNFELYKYLQSDDLEVLKKILK